MPSLLALIICLIAWEIGALQFAELLGHGVGVFFYVALIRELFVD